jgi:hypothetical protein
MVSERELLDSCERENWNFGDDQFDKSRRNVWTSVDSMLQKAAPYVERGEGCTGLALGYVQSGKTTSITALIAAAHDSRYKIVIGLVATNHILLKQNADRILERLSISEDGRKTWFTSVQKSDSASNVELIRNLTERDRTILVMVLKNAPQIDELSKLLSEIDTSKYKALVIDDEVDQVGLNNKIKKNMTSSIYDSILRLRNNLKGHLYVGYTATPYANLLLSPDDTQAPDFVEVLTPGDGYTGGQKFFVEEGDSTFRDIGAETLTRLPSKIPPNLELALATYLVGSAMMFCNELPESCEYTSMLINPHLENNVQEGYKSLLENHLQEWKRVVKTAISISELPKVFAKSYEDLLSTGVNAPEETHFLQNLKSGFSNYQIWLLNQTTEIKKVRWREYQLHFLIGAAKLDRGFTVEGLTVTYMSRKESPQIDTMQQRSRAFGYRPFIKYCRVFTTLATRKVLTETVTTEEDLRQQLHDWIRSGRSFKEWSREIGLIVGSKSKATRESVVKELTTRNLGGWHYLLKSNSDDRTLNYNETLIRKIGLENAALVEFGNQRHRVTELSNEDAAEFILSWHVDLVAQSQWDPALLQRTIFSPPPASAGLSNSHRAPFFKVILISGDSTGAQRQRKEWSATTGLRDEYQLMQGSNPRYPGDRFLFAKDDNVLQVHKILINSSAAGAPERALYFLAIRIGSNWKNIRRGGI